MASLKRADRMDRVRPYPGSPRQQCRGLIEAGSFTLLLRLPAQDLHGSNAVASLKRPQVGHRAVLHQDLHGSNAVASLKLRTHGDIDFRPVDLHGSNAVASLKLPLSCQSWLQNRDLHGSNAVASLKLTW